MFLAIDPFEMPESAAPAVVVGTTYPNGYLYRRALRVAGGALPGGETGLVLRFEETLPSFKSVANGGNVTSSLGYDIVFTDQLSTQVPHEFETYDPVAGTVGAWVALPDSGGGFDVDLWVYYGKPGVSTPQDDPASVWAGMLGCWRGGDYHDMTTNGRHMAATGSVAPGTILNQPAAVLSGGANAAYFELATAGAVAVLSGRAAVTSALLIKPSSVPAANADVARWGGTTAGTGWLGHTFFATGTAWRNYVRTDEPGTVFLIGPDAITAGHAYLFATTWAAGTPGEQVIDGLDVAETRSVTPAGTSEPLTGAVTAPSGTLLRVGAGFGDNAGAFVPGAYGRYFLWPAKKSAAFLAFLDRTVRYPHAVYGIGDEDVISDPDRSPVITPASGGLTAGSTASFALSATDPDGGPVTIALAAPAALLGTASMSGGALRYVAGAATGTDVVGLTATSGTKVARALALITVRTGTVVGGDILLPLAPTSSRTANWELARLSTAGATLLGGTTDETAGVELKAGVKDDANQPIALVSLQMFAAPFTLSLEYQPVSTWAAEAPASAAGVFSQICLYRTPGTDPDVSHLGTSSGTPPVWTANYAPADAYYNSQNATGMRFSFDTHSPGGTNDNQIRVRGLGGGATQTQLGGNVAFDFRDTAAHGTGWAKLTFSVTTGNDVSWTVGWPNGTSASESVSHADIGTYFGAASHNIILQCYSGRDAKFRNVVVTPGGTTTGTGAGTEGLAPDFPAIDPNKVTNCTPAGLQAAYNGLTATQLAGGYTICVNFFGFGNDTGNTVDGDLTFGKSGSASAPVAIRAGLWDSSTHTFSEPRGAANGAYFPDSAHPRGTVSFTGGCTVSGDHNWIRGLRFNGGVNVTGDGNRFNRCFHDGTSKLSTNLVVDTGVGNLWDWCMWDNFYSVGLQQLTHLGARKGITYRCFFRKQFDGASASGTMHMLGTNPASSISAAGVPYDGGMVSLDCHHDGAGGTASESWESKTSGARQLRCSTVGDFTNSNNTSSVKTNIRHGSDNQIIACYFNKLELRGTGAVIADCEVGNRNIGVATGDVTWTSWAAGGGSDRYPNAENTSLVRLDATNIDIGDSSTSHKQTYAVPTGTKLYDCTGKPVVETGHGTPTFTSPTGQPSNMVTSFTIPGGGTWTLRKTLDLALVRAGWDVSRVGPNGAYAASDDA